MQVLAIIGARSGSKGLPGKNVRPLLGRPLRALLGDAEALRSTLYTQPALLAVQWATAETTYRLTWADVEGQNVEVRVVSTLRVDIGPDGYDVVIEADAFDDEEQVGHREWREHLPR